MDYTKLTKETLVQMLENQESLNRQLLREDKVEKELKFAWTGNLGKWYWHFPSNTITFNPKKWTALGYDERDIPDDPGYTLFTDMLHPDDYEDVMEAMRAHLRGDKEVYEAEYRIRTKDGNYKWYYDRGKITEYSREGEPVFLAGIVFDITKQREMERMLIEKNKQLEELSYLDALTGIKNHRALIEGLRACIRKTSRNGEPLSLILYDIDYFKQVNDTLGHPEGDEILRRIASILEENSREGDIVGRYGGEEFMLILKRTAYDTAWKIAERIRHTVEATFKDSPIPITVSGGVVGYEEDTINSFVKRADDNLYEAKRRGKNRIV
ncbi:MAG: GGDEF domain-containing protein [Candidatus Izemoplasmataceae bacterium]